MYSCRAMPVPLLLLTACRGCLSTALAVGVHRDIIANRAAPTPEPLGLGVAVPLVLATSFFFAVEFAGLRFWDYLVMSAATPP